jgi:hypothetical protein
MNWWIDDGRRFRYFIDPESGIVAFTQSPKEAVEWFMSGLNEIDFYEWLNGDKVNDY